MSLANRDLHMQLVGGAQKRDRARRENIAQFLQGTAGNVRQDIDFEKERTGQCEKKIISACRFVIWRYHLHRQ
jgi:hypothetical protein